MSNRTDFDALALELVEMFRLDADDENEIGDTLLWRLRTELHNAFTAGQESTALPALPKLPAAAHPLLHAMANAIDGIDRDIARLTAKRAAVLAELTAKMETPR